MDRSDEPRWFPRGLTVDTSMLSVEADVFVHTEAEAARMSEASPWFQRLLAEIVWLLPE